MVRLAARVNATLLPFSGIGGDDSFSIVYDSDELLAAPLAGDFFRPRIEQLPSLVKDDVFVPPFGAITPSRHYFLFGAPISTAAVDPDDRAACEATYAQLRACVEGGLHVLQDEVRPADPYAAWAQRAAWEAVYDEQAPGPEGYKA